MKLTAITSSDDFATLLAELSVALSVAEGAGERLFALRASKEDGVALIHDLAGTIRTFRYIADAYGAALPDDDPQKDAKITQLAERLAELERLKELLRPLVEGR